MTHGTGDISVSLRGNLGTFALDVAFDAPMRGITALFGPSGCGKTTVLRCMAGLQKLSGRLSIGSEVWQDSEAGAFRPPHERHVGYVFQEASLFPHLSARDNLLFGARRVRGEPQKLLKFDDIVELLGIGHLLERATPTLSGGERQRIAVGRALLAQPRILLMDEPLSALDRLSKDEILPYFELLHEQLDLPIVYISHDFSEIERLADTLVLMGHGRIIASGPIRELQLDTTLPLLSSPEAGVVLEGVIARIDSEFKLTEIEIPGGRLLVAGEHGSVGESRRLRVAATDVSLARVEPHSSTILNTMPVQVQAIDTDADAAQAYVIVSLGHDRPDGHRIAARITRKSLVTLGICVGDKLFAQIKGVALVSSRTTAVNSPQAMEIKP